MFGYLQNWIPLFVTLHLLLFSVQFLSSLFDVFQISTPGGKPCWRSKGGKRRSGIICICFAEHKATEIYACCIPAVPGFFLLVSSASDSSLECWKMCPMMVHSYPWLTLVIDARCFLIMWSVQPAILGSGLSLFALPPLSDVLISWFQSNFSSQMSLFPYSFHWT